jgi:hypothetical protein
MEIETNKPYIVYIIIEYIKKGVLCVVCVGEKVIV